MSVSLEKAVRMAYAKSPEAVEPILTTESLRSGFFADVLSLCPGQTDDAVLQHLVRLRKRGEKKGGLPRKGK